MLLKKALLGLCLIIGCVLSGFAQEICDNAIDDDGDGFIDIQDEDCDCGSGMGISELYDFEQMSCCPDDYTGLFGSGIECLDNGWEVVAPTPDYFNLCDFFGEETTGSPDVPLPSGSGCIGFGNHLGFCEVVGTCLSEPLMVGDDVTVNFELGFGDGSSNQSISPFEMAVYGTTDCGNVSSASAWDCLENHGWTELGTTVVVGAMSSWSSATISFTADQDYTMLSVGASCNQLATNSSYTYHFLDDVEIELMEDPSVEVSEIELTGDCEFGFVMNIDEPLAVSYQWYLNGIAIVGATNATLDIQSPYEEGEYQVLITTPDGCGISEPFFFSEELEGLMIMGIVEDLLCTDDHSGSISLDLIGITAPVDIIWSNGTSQAENDNLEAGVYEVTITDANGCYGTESFEVDEPEVLEGTIVTVIHPTEALPTGSAQISGSGGTPPYSYLWSTGETSEVAMNLPPGAHTVTITDSNGCEFIIDLVINEILTLTADITDAGCHDACDGEVELNVDGGNPNYNYQWNTGDTGGDISNLCSGVYTVTVTDANETQLVEMFELTDDPELEVSGTIQGTLCPDTNEASIDLEVSGGTMPYTFLWSNGSVDEDIMGLWPMTYEVTVTDGVNCMITTSFEISPHPEIVFDAIIQDAGCGGQSNGGIQLEMEGGEGPFTFLWSTGDETQDILDITSGFYAVTVTDVHGCEKVMEFVVNEDSGIEVNTLVTSPRCPSSNDGLIELEIIGGLEPYSIDWVSLNLSAAVIDGISPGSYPLVVTDQNNCSWTGIVDVAVPDSIQNEAVLSDLSCPQANDGFIELVLIGNHPPFEVMWSNGENQLIIDSLTAGMYAVTVTDSLSCSYLYEYEISEPDSLEYDVEWTNISCFGPDLGSIGITGLTKEDILWNTGDSLYHLDSLPAGLYAYSITDVVGCRYEGSVLIQDLVANDTTLLTEYDCDIGNLGMDTVVLQNVHLCDSVIIRTVNFQEPDTSYETMWSCLNSELGLDTLNLTDSNGCDSIVIVETMELEDCSLEFNVGDQIMPCSDIFTIVEIELPIIAESPFEVIVEELNEAVEFGMTTMDSPITLELEQGLYEVVIMDAGGLTGRDTFMISMADPIDADLVVLSDHNGFAIDCYGSETGIIELDISAGQPPYFIEWSDGGVGLVRSDMSMGWHHVQLVDNNNCQYKDSIFLTEPQELGMELELMNPGCQDSEPGSITVVATGGVQPYAWKIDQLEFGNNNVFSDLSAGSYIVVCQDANGCHEEITTELVGEEGFNIDLGSNVSIEAGSTIEIVLDVDLPEELIDTVIWEGEGLSCMSCLEQIVQPDSTLIYQVTVVSENGCRVSDTILITVLEQEIEIALPNIFNPFSNVGNASFGFSGAGILEILDFSVFDRWGNQIFNIADGEMINESELYWDGKSNGQVVAQGVYVYSIEVLLIDGTSKRIYGDVTILY